MPVQPPTIAELARIAERAGLELPEERLAEYAAAIDPALDSFARLDELANPALPVRYPRTPGHRPAPEDNPCNGWVWRGLGKGAEEGALAGARGAGKDKGCGGGGAMLDGSPVIGGVGARGDAHRGAPPPGA